MRLSCKNVPCSVNPVSSIRAVETLISRHQDSMRMLQENEKHCKLAALHLLCLCRMARGLSLLKHRPQQEFWDKLTLQLKIQVGAFRNVISKKSMLCPLLCIQHMPFSRS